MYRQTQVIPGVPDPDGPSPGFPGPQGIGGSVTSTINAVWVTYPASWSQTDHIITRMTASRVLTLDGIIHGRLTAPQDTEPIPETIEFSFDSISINTMQNIEQIFTENFGKLVSVRSNPHNKIFFGVVHGWNIERVGTCKTNFSFDLLVELAANIPD